MVLVLKYISNIRVYSGDEYSNCSSCILAPPRSSLDFEAIEIFISDTESDKIAVIGNMPAVIVREQLMSIKPYGMIVGLFRMVPSAGFADMELIVLDAHSLKFLDYVDEVVEFDSCKVNLWGYNCSSFDFVDEYKSIIRLSRGVSSSSFRTLLQLLYLNQDCWYGDVMILHTSNGCWKVSFTDATRVRAFFAKLLVNGYNPRGLL